MITWRSYSMTRRQKVRKQRKVVSLLGGDNDADAATAALVVKQEEEGLFEAFLWKPSLDLRVVSQVTTK